MGIKKFTTKEYWDETRHAFSPFPVTTTPFAPYLEKYLPEKTSFRCVEIGGYPGTHLTYFAKRFGYHPTAIEYSEHWKDIQKLLEFNGITDYNIINKDFFDLGTIEPFDVVSSFG
ncbi:hypothetical protein RZS08_18090, partial [Arthrospira platensis SPKY1]|nr:hypothetical protein [Arthrospira platensis SPKY1]